MRRLREIKKVDKLGWRKRMCASCQALSPAERWALRADREPKGNVRTVSGGLPSLGNGVSTSGEAVTVEAELHKIISDAGWWTDLALTSAV
jgi:hypothetical protein